MSLPRVVISVDCGVVEVHCAGAAIGDPYPLDLTGVGGPGDGKLYGRRLFERLLGPVWPAICDLQRVKAARGVELALDWPAEAAELHRHLWEGMRDGDGVPLAANKAMLVAITRLVPSPATAVTVTRAARVLFAAGSELTDEVIRPGAMFMGMLRGLEAEGRCRTRAVQEISVDGLGEACREFEPDIVHLVAHGDLDADGRGVVVLARKPYTAEHLSAALGSPAVVALSACQSGAGRAAPLAAELVARGIPIVTAMTGDVTERACRLFTRRFVEAINKGEPVVEAAAMGRRAALLTADCPGGSLDWAHPAIFVSRSLETPYRAVDPAPGRRVVELADRLELRGRPVFIGHTETFRQVDELFSPDPGRRKGLLVLAGRDSIEGLGGTRLLREIGLRLLRAGHLPLLLGPYGDGEEPDTLRRVAGEILDRAVTITESLGLDPPPLHLLGGEFRDYGELLAALSEFGGDPALFDPPVLRWRLAADLDRLTAAAAEAGEPFGPHTRAVVLADEVHAWVGVLDDLLKIIKSTGLGSAERPAPVIATASYALKKGVEIKSAAESRAALGGFAFRDLRPLESREAALGFQWVLLNPWQAAERQVYVPARHLSAAKIQDYFDELEGIPTAVRKELYSLARLMVKADQFIASDDEAAYARYLENYG